MTESERLLEREASAVLVIDLQDAYRGHMHEEERVVCATSRLLDAAGILGIPVLLTEQYPKGLGGTREEIAAHLPPGTERFEKTRFSALGAEGLEARLRKLARRQIVVAGIETHVCVSQTVHELLAGGWVVHLPRDAVTARYALEDEAGWQKLLGAGAVPTSVEGVLFEWLRDARAPEFKAIHRLVV